MPQDPFRRAARIADVELSEIIQISEAAAALKRAGRDVISLGTGEPDFPTPVHVVAAAHAAAQRGETTYTRPCARLSRPLANAKTDTAPTRPRSSLPPGRSR